VVSAPGKLICQSLGAVSDRVPSSIVSPLRLIVASVLVKMAVQSALHSLPMLSKWVSPSAGNRSVLVASGGRSLQV